MTSPGSDGPMTPEQWRAVDRILQAALDCEPSRREAFVAEACKGDEALRREVTSLLAAHVDVGDEFLERPAAEVLGAHDPSTLARRLSSALAGRYEIDRELAHGGMATVFLARDLRHARHVAIKVLRPELAATLGAERFLAEIRVTASLKHPNILPLFDSGNADGLLWYAMPYVDGETLRTRLVREGSLPVYEAVRLAREVADALDHAHVHGILHRDVKPENVLLQDGHALVADFGIALALEHAGGERLTRTGLTLGTPQYMAPEQAAGERALDARVDVYALGAVLHEMLAGEPPFGAPTRQAVVRRMMHELPPMLAPRRPDVTPSVDSAVRRALAKLPADRFPSAAAFAAALLPSTRADVARDHTPVAGEREGAVRGRHVAARTMLYTALAALVIGLGGGLLIARSYFQPRGSENAPAKASIPAPSFSGSPLTVMDRSGRELRDIQADRPWTPRFSPDGRMVAYGAFGPGRQSSDLWIADLGAGTTRRITDDDADANDPQWNSTGSMLAYSANAPGGKDVMLRQLTPAMPTPLTVRDGTQFPSDWVHDGSAVIVTEDAGANKHDILVQPVDGSAARPLIATAADELAGRVSPDGHWIAYNSDESGRAEVYVNSYPRPGVRVKISQEGGIHPVWRGDGRELFYWRDGALVAVALGTAQASSAPTARSETVLFHAPYPGGLNAMYDVSPDGQKFVIVRQP